MCNIGVVMERINLNEDIQPLSEFRNNMGSFIKQIKKTKRPLVITQNGKSSAVLLDVNYYEDLLDRLELLQDIQLAESQIKTGKVVSHDSVKSLIMEKLKK